jgi:hypothetical protein
MPYAYLQSKGKTRKSNDEVLKGVVSKTLWAPVIRYDMIKCSGQLNAIKEMETRTECYVGFVTSRQVLSGQRGMSRWCAG